VKTAKKQHLDKALVEGVHVYGLGLLQLCIAIVTDHACYSTYSKWTNCLKNLIMFLKNLLTYLHSSHIPLVQGTKSVNKRSYKYAKNHTDIFDNLIQKYSKSEVIQNNSNLYASHLVLINKKDRSWQMCVDYMKLNKSTVKNKFSISLVHNLLHQLHGSIVFSKIRTITK